MAEKAIQELETEILRQDPSTARLNSRICNRGLSAREMWNQSDLFTNKIQIDDNFLISQQYK